MNQVNWLQIGGRRAKNDTYAHAFAGVTDAIKGMLDRTGSTAANGVILSGCEFTLNSTNNADITAGYVYIAGEVYYVPAASGVIKTSSDTFVIKVVETTVAPSLVFADGVTYNIHLQRRAALSFEPNATAGNFMPATADTIYQRLHGKWLSYTPAVATDATGVWTLGVGTARYRYDEVNETLHLEVAVESTLATATAAFLKLKLPNNRAGSPLSCASTVGAIGLHGGAVLSISADADPEYLRLELAAGGSFSVGSLDNISFNITIQATS